MNRNKKIIRNFIILIVWLILFFNFSMYKLSPISAHEASEKSIHYGPSEIVHIEDFKEGKFILCKYENYISCNTVNKVFGFLWRFGNHPTGIENKKDKAVSFSCFTSDYCKLFGIINDKSITRIEVKFNDGTIKEQTEFYDDMFLFTWHYKEIEIRHSGTLTAYNDKGEIVFTENY